MSCVLVYNDEGVCNHSLEQLLEALKEEGYSPQTVDSFQIIHNDWEEHTRLIIFPGGRDIPYHESLSTKGTERIRKFVEQGGCYFGICAGAYFGCASFVFEEGSPLEITANRDLKFFPGQGCGPAYGTHLFQYDSSEGARLAELQLKDNSRVSVFYEGGCLFKNAETYSNVNVYARYADIPNKAPAIVICRVGEGKAILSGVHPEYSPSRLDTDDIYLKKLVPSMKLEEKKRRLLFQSLLNEAFQ